MKWSEKWEWRKMNRMNLSEKIWSAGNEGKWNENREWNKVKKRRKWGE